MNQSYAETAMIFMFLIPQIFQISTSCRESPLAIRNSQELTSTFLCLVGRARRFVSKLTISRTHPSSGRLGCQKVHKVLSCRFAYYEVQAILGEVSLLRIFLLFSIFRSELLSVLRSANFQASQVSSKNSRDDQLIKLKLVADIMHCSNFTL